MFLGFSAPITDLTAATRGGRRPQSFLPALNLCSSLLSHCSSHSCGWSLSLRSEQVSVNEVVAVKGREEQAGREEEEVPDVCRSGKGMFKCMWRALQGTFPVQEHDMFA